MKKRHLRKWVNNLILLLIFYNLLFLALSKIFDLLSQKDLVNFTIIVSIVSMAYLTQVMFNN